MIKTLTIAALIAITAIGGYFYAVYQNRSQNHVDALRVEANAICRARGENDKGCQVMRDRVHAKELHYGSK